MQQKIRRANSKAKPTTEPTTMPAIAPPESPRCLEEDAVDPSLLVEVGDEVTVVVKREGIVDVAGKVTSEHLDSTFDAEQQESVELTELELQYEQSPTKFPL